MPRAGYEKDPVGTQKRQAVQAPKGLPHGERKELEDAQRSLPLPKVDPMAEIKDLATAFDATDITSLGAPTEFADEPITAGLPVGAGPGPEILRGAAPANNPLTYLEGVYMRFPSPELRSFIDQVRNSPGREI